jgi:CHAT domain-containing protein
VLSACETGVGKKVRGEGLMALTRGFMYAGAKRVVASLWQVNDASTARLMKYFYEGMLRDKLSPAAALRAAQLGMLKQPTYGAPYYWAAFVVQGEWQGWSPAPAPNAGDEAGRAAPRRRQRRALRR